MDYIRIEGELIQITCKWIMCQKTLAMVQDNLKSELGDLVCPSCLHPIFELSELV